MAPYSVPITIEITRREEADLERRLAAGHDPAELVEAVLVGAERPRRAASGLAAPGARLAFRGWVRVWLVW